MFGWQFKEVTLIRWVRFLWKILINDQFILKHQTGLADLKINFYAWISECSREFIHSPKLTRLWISHLYSSFQEWQFLFSLTV